MEQASRRPNVVIVHTHDSGRYFDCYGGPVKTPHINALAAQGVRLDQYFTTAPQCSPSRASALTGLYPHRSGMMGLAHLGWSYYDSVCTLPHRLAEAGYETFLFGTQHEAKDGSQIGYQHTVHTKMPQLAHEVAPRFADFVRERAKLNPDRPFFASVGFWETHRPFDKPPSLYKPDDPSAVPVPPYLPDTELIRRDLADFHGMVKAVDEAVGLIVRALDESGLSQNTLLIFTTDHGIAFPRAKGTLYDSGTGIAGIFRWPGRLPEGKVCTALLSNVDLTPTILDAVGVPQPDGLDGVSFWPVLVGEAEATRDHVFLELTWHDRYSPVRGVRTSKWKYIRHFTEGPSVYLPYDIHTGLAGQSVRELYYSKPHPPEELYDLENDPLEQHNLAGDPSAAQALAEMRARLERWMQETNDPLLHGHPPGRESPRWEEERRAGTIPVKWDF